MVAFISIVFAITLLLITVYGLHKYQNIEISLNAERSIPLPPLDDKNPENNHQQNTAAAKTDVSNKNKKSSDSSWMDEVNRLKAEGEYDRALSVCKQQFPLWSAYNQSSIILRLKLKLLSPEDPRTDTTLKQLYQIAAIGEFLHEKSTSSRHLSLKQLRQLELSEIDQLPMEYRLLGYANLRLIRKSDIKLMISLWGRPGQHALPRTLHEVWWNKYVSQIGPE